LCRRIIASGAFSCGWWCPICYWWTERDKGPGFWITKEEITVAEGFSLQEVSRYMARENENASEN
jgi:hypothetical protein